MKSALVLLSLLCLTFSTRILYENTGTSDKWSFTLFSTSSEQNTQTFVLPTDDLLVVQNKVDETGWRQLQLQKFQQGGTPIGQPTTFQNVGDHFFRPKVTLLNDSEFLFAWIQKIEDKHYLYIQTLNYGLTATSGQIQIAQVHNEVSWDQVSEFYYVYQINNENLLIMIRSLSSDKAWAGQLYNYKTQQSSNQFSIAHSDYVEIGGNQLGNVILLQKICVDSTTCYVQVTKINSSGEVLTNRTLKRILDYQQYQPKLTSLSNNNFVVFYQYSTSITYEVFDQHFDSKIFTSSSKYYGTKTPSWEYQGYFRGGQIQTLALQDSVVLVGINYDNLRFQLVQLNNDYLEFIQFREIHFQDLNLYKYSIQKLNGESIFVQWIDGIPQTMLPEFKQNLFLSQLSLKLNINNCDKNCISCQNNSVCQQCLTGYNLVNNVCVMKCIDNCQQCSTQITCDVCSNGFIQNNILQCVDANTHFVEELRISQSDTTFKYNQRFKEFDNGNLLIFYQEQFGSDISFQLRLLDSAGNIINSYQLPQQNLIGYDIILLQDRAYLYTIDVTDNYYVVRQTQFNPQTFEFSTIIRFQIQDQGFTYSQIVENMLTAVPFEKSVALIIQGIDRSTNIQLNVYFYQYDGKFLNNQYLGYVQYFDYNQDFKYIGYESDEEYLRILISRGCDLQFLHFSPIGERKYDATYNVQQYVSSCNGVINPVISKVQFQNQYMIAIQQEQFVIVFYWKSFSKIYITDENIKASKPSLISLAQDKFVLIYEAYDLEGRFNSIHYVRFAQDQITGPIVVNQKSVYSYNLRIHNNFYDHVTLSWLGYKNTQLYSTNQVYFQRVSLIDNTILGINKQCPTNCKTCDDTNNCLECQSNYSLLDNNSCQLQCSSGCSQCSDSKVCQVCSGGFQLTQNLQCQASNSNYITTIKKNVNLIESIDMDTNSNGNTLISWMQLNEDTNNVQTFIKQIDQNGQQVGTDFLYPFCSSSSSKVYSLNSYNVIASLCGNVESGADLSLNFYDMNFNFRYMNWGVGSIRTQQYSLLDTPYDILFLSDREFIVASQNMNSNTDVWLRLLRVRKHDFENYFYVQNENSYHFGFKLNSLKLKSDQNYVYTYFENIITDDQGQVSIIRNQLQTNFELNEISRSSNLQNQQQFLILDNSNRLIVSNSNSKIDISIMNKNKQISNQHIEVDDQDIQKIEKVDITATETGFYLAWIEIDLSQNTKQLKAQGFYNNGTQISEKQNLNQLSTKPSDFIIQSLRDNQLIALWLDFSDDSQQNVVAARYNKFLQIVPLNTKICLSHCDSCSKTDTCSQCSSGYHFVSTLNQCSLTCVANCEICTQKDFCDVCQTGFYLINDQCITDNNKHEEVVLQDIQDSEKTRVSITSFSDNSFVIAWNDLLESHQSIFLKFYDNKKLPVGDVIKLNGDTDKQYMKVESFEDDTFAMVWFDGNCADSCRLQFKVLDKNGQVVFNEYTITILTLPPLGQQSPVVIKRKGRQLIIAYISYENNKTVGYYTYYDIDSQTVYNPSLIEADNNIDNLEISYYNEVNYSIYYVRNNVELIVMRFLEGNIDNFSIHGSSNQVRSPSVLVRTDGNIMISWVEKVLNNGYWVDKVFIQRCDYNNYCFWSRQLDSYQYEQQYLPKLTGRYGNQGYERYSIIYGTQDFQSNLRRKLRLVSYTGNDWDVFTNQLNIVSYIIKSFDIKEFSSDETILVSVGQMSDKTNKILITKFDMAGNQQLFGDTICQQNCEQCTSDQVCLSCELGYTMNSGKCERQCDLNCKSCDPYWNDIGFQCYECQSGFQLNSKQQCLPVDNSISQSLINTYQNGNQFDQKVTVLTNHFSIVVWTSENQNKYGKSIYLQLYDPQFNKVGPETLITKDNIGVQEQPDVVALTNNEFMIIWKDNNSIDGRRILMQRFNSKIERVGDEITVYDSTIDLYLSGDSAITYLDSYHQIVSSQNGHISVVVLLKASTTQYDIKLKQYNELFLEYNSLPIGSTNSYDQCSINVLNNLIFVSWKSIKGVKVMTINDQGHIVNGEIVDDSLNYSYPVITPISQDEIILTYSNNNNLIIQKYNLSLQKVNDPIQTKSDYRITGIQIVNAQSGYFVVYKVLKQSQYYSSDLLYLVSFDSNDSILSSKNLIVNNFYGSIRDVRLSALSNGEVLISWTQLINNYLGDVKDRNQDDFNGDGVYIKRYDSLGNVISIQNVVCQSYCKQCSSKNLCEACSDGYQFDSNKQNCLPICPSNCNSCTRQLGQYKSYCSKCKDGYNVNDQGDCVKNIINDSLQLYRVGDGIWEIRDVLTLSNGNIVVIKQRYFSDMFLKVISPAGDVIANEIYVENSCCEKIVKATALADGGFALAHRSYNYWDTSNIFLVMYDQDGRQLKSQWLNNFATWNTNYWWWWYYAAGNSNWLQIKSLSDGGFVVLYMTDNDGTDYHNPQLYLRIYNRDLYLSRNEIKLKTYFNNNYYWDWWRSVQNAYSQSINIIDSVNQIIISFGTCMYNGWDEDRNYIQIFVYDKQGQFIQNTQVEVQNDVWWNAGFSPRFYIFQKSLNQFIIVSFSNQQVYATYFDANFVKQEQKQLSKGYYWDTCYGCCYYCQNQFTIQALLMKNSLIISSKPDSNVLLLQSFTHNLEPITDSKSIQISRHDSGLQWNHFINQYTSEIILVTQILDTWDDVQRNLVFDKYDSLGNKQEKWSVCGDNCINCLENEKQCRDCKTGYYPDANYQCKARCEYKNCKTCNNVGTDQQYCSQCNDGYELKDNSECIIIDSQKIRQTALYVNREGQNTPRIKKFKNGEILVLDLYNVSEIYGQYFDQSGKKVGQSILMLKDDKINYYDFSVSVNEDFVVIGWISTADNSAKAQKFDIDLKKVGSQFTLLDSVDYYEVFLLTIDYLENNKIVCILYGQRLNWMKLVDEVNAPLQFKQIQYDLEQHYCDNRFDLPYWDIYRNQYGLDRGWNYWNCYWGNNYINYWQIYDKNSLRHIDYFQNWYPQEPATLITQDYIIVLIQHYNSIHAQTFDYFGNLKYQAFFRYNTPSQPSLAKLENGQIVIVWKDQLYNYDSDVPEQEVAGQKNNIIAYIITDEQFNQARYQYFSMNSVEEERPSVTAITGGFAISVSGRSEIANFNIDLRVVYFDLYGNIQTGYIPVSTYNTQPTNSNIEQLNDGTILVSWYQNEYIYVQKLDRNGVIKSLNKDIICSDGCKSCTINQKCDMCLDGYHLTTNSLCKEDPKPVCSVSNCDVCESYSGKCKLCKKGYFLEENLISCTSLSSYKNLETEIAKSNIGGEQSTVVLQIEDGTIIHLWLNKKLDGSGYELLGQTFSFDSSQILPEQYIIDVPLDVSIKADTKYSKIAIIVYNSLLTQVIQIDQNLVLLYDVQDLTSYIKQEFQVSFDWKNQEVHVHQQGYLLQIKGVKQVTLDEQQKVIRKCEITKLLIFQFDGSQQIPPFGFWIDGQSKTNILDDKNKCKIELIHDILYEDYIYVLSDLDWEQNKRYLTVYDYNGVKLKERFQDYWTQWGYYWWGCYGCYWWGWWGNLQWMMNYYSKSDYQLQLVRLENQEIAILNREGAGITINNDLNMVRTVQFPINTYFTSDFDLAQVYLRKHAYVNVQRFGEAQRYRFYTYDEFDPNHVQESSIISRFTINQGSFNMIRLNEGQLLFNWKELNNNNGNFGSIIVMKLSSEGILMPFPAYQCVQYCNLCQNEEVCQKCKPNYELTPEGQCSFMCSDNCVSCSSRNTCDICIEGYVLDDNQQCYPASSDLLEEPIPTKRTDQQNKPRVAAFKDGSFVVVWQSKNEDGDGFGVYGQKFGYDLNKIGDEIRINEIVVSEQYFPDVTILDDQSIIIIWADGDIELQADLYYQKFDSDFVRIGHPVLISSLTLQYLTYYDTPCVVQALPNNQFSVIWLSSIYNSDMKTNVYVTIFDQNGQQKETDPSSYIDSTKEIVVASNGYNFVTVFNQGCQLKAAVYDLDGIRQSINDIVYDCASSPSITSNSIGEYIVTFQINSQIYFRIFDSNFVDSITNNRFQVDYVNSLADNPDIITLSDNRIVITWQNKDISRGRSRKLRMQIFDRNGAKLTNAQEINYISLYAELPQISILNNDAYIIVWQAKNGNIQQDSDSGIYLMRFKDGVSIGGGLPQIICQDKCQQCEDQQTCIKCSIDYDLVDSICVPKCPYKCNTCSISNICEQCENGYVINKLGQCVLIGSDPLPSLINPEILVNPTFSSIASYNINSVVVYAGTVINLEEQYGLDIKLNLYTQTINYEYTVHVNIDLEWLHIYNSDLLIMKDQIVVYWTQQSQKKMKIELHAIILDSKLKEINNYIIDTFDLYNYEVIKRKVHIVTMNGQYYYIFQSIQSTNGKFDLASSIVDKNQHRISSPTNIFQTDTQLYRRQIEQNDNTYVLFEYTRYKNLRILSISSDLWNFSEISLGNVFGTDIDENSISIKRLHNENYVISWKHKSQLSLCSVNTISYLFLNPQLQTIGSKTMVLQSNDVLSNPLVISTTTEFFVLWNQQSVAGDSLNIKIYSQEGQFVKSIEKLNQITNNVVAFFSSPSQNDDVFVSWISNIQTKYQFYLAIINNNGVQTLPSIQPKCKVECLTCKNEFTCTGCPDHYVLDDTTHQCVIQCPLNCKSCDETAFCIECSIGYRLENNKCIKLGCELGSHCALCNESSNCIDCELGYVKNQQNFNRCDFDCSHCRVCEDNTCKECEESYYWDVKKNQCEPIEIAIFDTDVNNPLRATFPTGDYVLMWYETGENEGIYLQLFRKNNKPVGSKTKVNKDELLSGGRLLQQSQYEKKFFADLAIIENELVVLWIDQTLGDMKVKFKKFDNLIREVSEEVIISEQQKQDLSQMAAPCLISKTNNNQFVAGWFNQVKEQIATKSKMFLQTFTSNLQPLGQITTLLNADLTKVPVISADKDGVISITYSSQGYTYLAQMSQDGIFIADPLEIAHPGQDFKSTTLNNGNMVFVFEAQSTNVSPPQFILSYEIMNENKEFTQGAQLTQPQFGEEHPDVTKIKDGFIITWRTIDRSFKSSDVYYQVFDNFGQKISPQIMVERQGIHPSNPRAQILNDDDFIISWTGENILKQKGNKFYMQQYKFSEVLLSHPIICSENCQNCNQNKTCLLCYPGYYIEGGNCQIECPQDCAQCTESNICDQCKLGFELTWDDQCNNIECESGYRLNADFDCEPICSDKCEQCLSQEICIQCESGHKLNQGKCVSDFIETPISLEDNGFKWYQLLLIMAGIILLAVLALNLYKRFGNKGTELPTKVESSSNSRDETTIMSSNNSD